MSSELITPGLPEPQGRGEDPLYNITRIYLLFLQGLFKQFPEGSYRWSDDEKLSEITITDQVPVPKDRIEQRPAIVTMRGPAQFANLTLDQMRTVDVRTGMKERTDLLSATMTMSVLSRSGVEAGRIAWIIARHIRTFKTLIQRAGLHKIGDTLTIGPETPPGSMVQGEVDPEMVMVTVQSPFFVQWTEQSTPLDAVMLKNIELHLIGGLPQPAALTTDASVELRTLNRPTIRGRAIGQAPSYPNNPIDQQVKT